MSVCDVFFLPPSPRSVRIINRAKLYSGPTIRLWPSNCKMMHHLLKGHQTTQKYRTYLLFSAPMAGPKNLNSDFLYPTYFKLDFIDVMIVFWHSNVILFDVLQKSDWENFSLAINGPQNDFKRGLEIPICKVPTLRPNKGTMRFCILDIFGGTRISCKLGQINQKKMQRRAPG